VLTITGAGQIATPESESLQVNVTVTLALFQPFAFGGCDELADTVGGVLSMFSVMLVVALLPALSVAVPEMTCPAPSVVTV
jgi:hypothetical protein